MLEQKNPSMIKGDNKKSVWRAFNKVLPS